MYLLVTPNLIPHTHIIRTYNKLLIIYLSKLNLECTNISTNIRKYVNIIKYNLNVES